VHFAKDLDLGSKYVNRINKLQHLVLLI